MVFTAYLALSISLITVIRSAPVPPNDPPKTFGSRPGTRVQSSRQPRVFQEDAPLTDIDVTTHYGTAETISIPSVNEEKAGRGWMNNIAGPPLESFPNQRPTHLDDSLARMYHNTPTTYRQGVQPFKSAKLQKGLAMEEPKTAIEVDVEESNSSELAYIPGGNIKNDDRKSTARFNTEKDESRMILQFSDADDQGVYTYLDAENEVYEEEKEEEYDPVRDPFYKDYPLRSKIHHTLRKLLEEPLYKPLPSWKGEIDKLSINIDDSYRTAGKKMRHNLQPIYEGASMMEMQSTVRGGDALPHLRKKIGMPNRGFLPQGRESLQLPSPGLTTGPRIASIVNYNDNSNTFMSEEPNIYREPHTATLTLPEITSSFRRPRDTNIVPKLRLGMNGQATGP
ncbi:hypothetical protein TWF730_005077 [Orbilia blumenaviensis]|uniref:Uncharacterized protein n=1 Tax=Orbilia blumenaviensis TaxID=1796055 RepID=A0AAV9VIC8_9PEZI